MGAVLLRVVNKRVEDIATRPEDSVKLRIAKRLCFMAANGDLEAIRFIYERLDGPSGLRQKQAMITDSVGAEIEEHLGQGDLIGAISTIYGIRITDPRTGISTTISAESIASGNGSSNGHHANAGGDVITVTREPACGVSEAGTAEERPAALSLPEAVDRGPQPPEDK